MNSSSAFFSSLVSVANLSDWAANRSGVTDELERRGGSSVVFLVENRSLPLRHQVRLFAGEPCCELVPQLFRHLYHLVGFVVRDRTDLLVHRSIPLLATAVEEGNVRLV